MLIQVMDTTRLKQLYESERDRLNYLCEKWQTILDSTKKPKNEDNKGAILSVLGQTRLLLNKKLKQFEQLLTDSEQVVGDKKITLTDLEGFWELVMIQVDEMHTKFENLEQLNLNMNETTRSQRTSVNNPRTNVLPKYR